MLGGRGNFPHGDPRKILSLPPQQRSPFSSFSEGPRDNDLILFPLTSISIGEDSSLHIYFPLPLLDPPPAPPPPPLSNLNPSGAPHPPSPLLLPRLLRYLRRWTPGRGEGASPFVLPPSQYRHGGELPARPLQAKKIWRNKKVVEEDCVWLLSRQPCSKLVHPVLSVNQA